MPQYSFQIESTPKRAAIAPNRDIRLGGHGNASRTYRRPHRIKYLWFCNLQADYLHISFKKDANSRVIEVPEATMCQLREM